VPALPDRNGGGPGRPGGSIVGYPFERLRQEVAYIAYHFHWPYDQIMGLDHLERLAWVKEIAEINRKLAGVAAE
jgi:hypothetical protein